MSKLFEYLDFPSIDIDSNRVDYIINNTPDTYIYPNNGRYAIFDYPEIEDYGTKVFGKEMRTKIQVLYPPEMVIHVDQRDVAYNYIIDPGGDDVYTCYYDENLNVIEKHKIESGRWHKLDVTVLHNVIGMTRPRVALTIYPATRENHVDPVFEIDYKFDMDVLWKEYHRFKNLPQPEYEFRAENKTKKNTLPGIAVYGSQNHGEDKDSLLMQEAKKFCKHYGIKDSILAQFLWLDKNFFLSWHKDDATRCQSSVNVIMTEDPSPVEFRGGEYDYQGKFYYKCAALDVMKEHSVQNDDRERILMRISFKDLSHADLVNNYLRK